jgi:hypothetical protein
MVHTLLYFSAERGAPDGLAFGYGALATGRIEEGLKRLRRSFRLR